MNCVYKWIMTSAVIIMLIPGKVHAQLQTLSSHYYLNQLTFNPAAAGADAGINIFANYRGQWIGIEGSPQTQTFAADMSLPMINSGAGFTFTNDLIGAERHTSVRANFAYFLDIGKNYRLGFGVAGGITNTSIDGNKLTTPEGGDDFLPEGKQGLVRPDLAAGVFLHSDAMKVGLSYNNLIRSATIDGIAASLETKYGSYFNIYAAYKATFGKRFGLEPSVLVRTDFVNWQTDIGAMFDYTDFIFFGVFFRGYNNLAIDAFYATVGLKPVGNFSVFFSYDLGLSNLNDVHNGSFELSIKVSVPENKLFKRGKIIYNPRYL
jgi:type IX secretion system PorP/SprF family membrane protein